MEFLHPPFPNRTFSPRVSLREPKFSSKTTTKFLVPISKTPPTPFFLPFSSRKILLVSAHFGRPSIRRNSLRKKLVDDQKVRQRNLLPLIPSSDTVNPLVKFDNMDNSEENLGYDSVKESNSNYGVGVDKGILESDIDVKVWEPNSKKLGESVLLSKLENWVDQYKEDSAYWGIGSNPIFTVFHDFEGNVKRVLVNEDEIFKRSQVKNGDFEDTTVVDSKILCAKDLAREMERGGNVIPRNSSLAKFVVLGEETGFVSTIRSAVLHPEFVPVLSRVGRMTLYGFVAIWAVKKLFTFRHKEDHVTEFEKEMMRRKIKSRKEKEMLEKKDNVEVVQEPLEQSEVLLERPKLDKQQLKEHIFEAQSSKDKLVSVNSFISQTTEAAEFDEKVQKIRVMARKAREIESRKQSMGNKIGEKKQPVKEDFSIEMQVVEEHTEEIMSFSSGIQSTDSGERSNNSETMEKTYLNKSKSDNRGQICEVSSEENMVLQAFSTPGADNLEDGQKMSAQEVIASHDTTDGKLSMSKNGSFRKKPRFIRSVKEAREFLAKKGEKHNQESQENLLQAGTPLSRQKSDEDSGGETSQRVNVDGKVLEPSTLGRAPNSLPVRNAAEESIPNEKKVVPKKNDDSKNFVEHHAVSDPQELMNNLNHEINGSSKERRHPVKSENWIEKNFHEVEPILKKIGDGFKDNYKVAREKISQDTNISTDTTLFNYNADDSEFEWMKDDSLKEIVFQVRENELAGRDPFYLMDVEDKLKFFKGLEKKVEKENEKLLQVHEYLHSNIENLDYGADGVSVYDPPEKFIPRWKGPPLEKNPEFLNNFLEQRNAISARNAGTSYPVEKDEQNFPQKSTGSPVNEDAATSSADHALKKGVNGNDRKYSKTVIEGSDGSIRAGKKSGKEYWQHTKKWSRGFLESYNAETDPEVKSVMKDIGKDLDRWITEEEIQEASDLMTKLPEKNKKFIEKKISKLKREMELFGPQAVVSKYREYAEEKEEDYLWWLDLPHVLCIELYTIENEEQKIGFYSLEMAADLELEPKPCHVIAFEDAGDCKNLCYIIQAHMDMLGNGHAFVVPRPPKDAFREAKANGFGVTVIRKGELQLNVDQTLEEVEEEITEIGSKIYHDKLTRDRSVDINSLMKGVFGSSSTNSKRKRSKRAMKKRIKK